MKQHLISLLFAVAMLIITLPAFANQQPDTMMPVAEAFHEITEADTINNQTASSILLSDAEKGTGIKPVTILRGLLGLAVLILIAFLLSSNR
ncbi:MAG TPA: hypothetical protein ENN08_02225, partial [Bacteroidales bacterium]|nr:hypothetical protein [Bacteroidales bacterium]